MWVRVCGGHVYACDKIVLCEAKCNVNHFQMTSIWSVQSILRFEHHVAFNTNTHTQHICVYRHTVPPFFLAFPASVSVPVPLVCSACKWDRSNGVCMHEIIMCSLSLLLPFFFLYFIRHSNSNCVRDFQNLWLKNVCIAHSFFIFLHIQFQSLYWLYRVHSESNWYIALRKGMRQKSNNNNIESIIIQLKKLIPPSLFRGYNKWSVDKRKLRNHFPRL